jgi:hypothetical protein
MKRDPLRLVVALLLVASAALFVVGSRAERHSTTALPSPSASPSAEPASAAPRQSASPAPTATGREGSAAHEAAEHTPSATTSPARSAAAAPQKTGVAGAEGSASREAAERAGTVPSSERVFGVDIEQPAIVAAGAFIMVVLAAMAFGWRRRDVLLAVAVFALAFAAFDLREAQHQSSAGRTSILVIASVLACMHVAAALLAGISLASSTRRPPPPV